MAGVVVGERRITLLRLRRKSPGSKAVAYARAAGPDRLTVEASARASHAGHPRVVVPLLAS